jgi:HAD superfamily hydrolase (TIGR01509 family)
VLREQIMGRPAVDSLRVMIEFHALTDPVEELLRESGELMLRLMETSLAAMPGVYELLADLDAARVPYGVATSATREYADYVLARLDIEQRFRVVLTAEDIRHGKPAPDVYLLAAERFGMVPPQTMVLEDSANGCRAGVAAGAFTVAVPNHHTQKHDFNGARFVADTLADPRSRAALGLA